MQVPNMDDPVQVKYANKDTLVYETASSQVTQAALEFTVSLRQSLKGLCKHV